MHERFCSGAPQWGSATNQAYSAHVTVFSPGLCGELHWTFGVVQLCVVSSCCGWAKPGYWAKPVYRYNVSTVDHLLAGSAHVCSGGAKQAKDG